MVQQWTNMGAHYFKDDKKHGLHEVWEYDGDLIERAIYDSDVKIKSLPTDVSLQELVDRGELNEMYLY